LLETALNKRKKHNLCYHSNTWYVIFATILEQIQRSKVK